MKYLINIIFKRSNEGFSLIEIILAISLGTFILLTIVSGVFVLHNGFNKAKDEAVLINEISKFTQIIINDTLNPDLFPHHPFKTDSAEGDGQDSNEDIYIFNKDSIVFFANGGKVEYKLTKNDSEVVFTVTRNEDKGKTFNFIKDFNVVYYDKKDFEIIDPDGEDFPHYCKLNFKFYDNKILNINMKL